MRLLSCLSALLLATACNLVQPEDAVRVRVKNVSGYDFQRVIVIFPEETVEYGDVPSGGASPYAVVSRAFGYGGYVEVHVGEQRFIEQYIDNMGAVDLPNGSYTYALDLSSLEETYGLDQHLERD